MCSSPVTFGGGTAIEYFGLGLFASALKSSASAHRADQRGSTACGSYAGGMDLWSVMWACFHLGRGWSAGAGGSLAGCSGTRRPGYAYVDLLAAHDQISLYPRAGSTHQALRGSPRGRRGGRSLVVRLTWSGRRRTHLSVVPGRGHPPGGLKGWSHHHLLTAILPEARRTSRRGSSSPASSG